MAKNNIGNLLDSLQKQSHQNELPDSKDELTNLQTPNPAINLAGGMNTIRATTTKEPVLHLKHDQVIFFKYHDRHISSLDSIKVRQIRQSIESDEQHFPGIVRKTNQTTQDGRVIYELIVGRIRYEASKGVGVFKAFLKNVDDAEAIKLMFSENENRQDITPFERWLSIIPIIKDEVLSVTEIAASIGVDKGNLSRSLQAIPFYEKYNIQERISDVSNTKLNTLIELANFEATNPVEFNKALDFIASRYPDLKNNSFLKAVAKKIKSHSTPKSATVLLTDSKVQIKQLGDKLDISFKGLPAESDFDKLIEELKKMDSLQ